MSHEYQNDGQKYEVYKPLADRDGIERYPDVQEWAAELQDIQDLLSDPNLDPLAKKIVEDKYFAMLDDAPFPNIEDRKAAEYKEELKRQRKARRRQRLLGRFARRYEQGKQ